VDCKGLMTQVGFPRFYIGVTGGGEIDGSAQDYIILLPRSHGSFNSSAGTWWP
jgi:hypothetical protein